MRRSLGVAEKAELKNEVNDRMIDELILLHERISEFLYEMGVYDD